MLNRRIGNESEHMTLAHIQENMEQIDNMVQKVVGLLEGFDARSQELIAGSMHPILSYNERQGNIIKNIKDTIQVLEELDLALSIRDKVGHFLQSDPESPEAMQLWIKYLKQVRDSICLLKEYEIGAFQDHISELYHIYDKSMATLESMYRLELTSVSQMTDHGDL
jgi:hypothetical protein